MKVLFATPDHPPETGGIQNLTAGIVGHREHVDYTVLTLAMEGDEAYDAAAGHRIVREPRTRRHQLDIVALNRRFLREARSGAYDVVVSGHITLAPAAAAARRPWVQWVYAKEVPRRPALARTFLPRATAVVAISRHAEALAVEHGARPERVSVIPPGATFGPAGPASRHDVRTILHVAQLNEAYKGTDMLIRSMPGLLRDTPDLRLTIIGQGRLREQHEREVRDLGLQDHVEFLGRVSDAVRDERLATASVFAMPSRLPPKDGGEGFGIVYLEATAAGLPVLAGDVGGARDAVRDGVTGVLVDPDSVAAVEAGLRRCLTDERLRASVAAHRDEWLDRFSWGTVTPQIESVLSAVAAARRAG